MNNKRLVFVYSIPRESAFGMHDWTSDAGNKLKKNKVGRATDTLCCLYSPKVGGLANYISYTPWIEEGVQKYDEVTKQPLMLQDKLEIKWNKPKGFFTNRAYMKGDSLKDSDLSYFQRSTWRLNDGCTIFDLNTMEGEMGYYMALASPRIANSEKEWRQHVWPKAQYYIALENESEEIKYKRNDLKIKAVRTLGSNDLTDIIKRKLVSLLDIANTKASMTQEQVTNALYEYIDKSTFEPNSNIDKFLNNTKMLNTPDGRENFEARYLIKQGVDTRVLTEKAGTYTFLNPVGPLEIGNNLDEAISFILNPKKSSDVDLITEMIKAKQ